MHVCAQYMLCTLLGNMTRELSKTLHAEGGNRQELKVLTQPHCCALLVYTSHAPVDLSQWLLLPNNAHSWGINTGMCQSVLVNTCQVTEETRLKVV